MALLKINNTAVSPTPTVIQATISDLDSDGTGRDATGTMFRDRITTKRKVHCEWGILTKTEMSTLLGMMTAQSFSFTYPDPQTGEQKTITAYVGDRSPAVVKVISDSDWMWTGLSVDFVEM